jgi:Carbohydrate binding domain
MNSFYARIKVVIFTVLVLACAQFGYCDVTVLAENDILDAAITGAPGYPADWIYPVFNLRETWHAPSIYDGRGFMIIDLSSIPTDATVGSVELGLYYFLAYGGANIDNLFIGYTTDEFTTAFTWIAYDGINNWTDGDGAGVDPWAGQTPNQLATVVCDPAGGVGYKMINTVALTDYIQAQVSGGKNAYLWLAIDNEEGKYQRFAATEYEQTQVGTTPYLSVTWTNAPAGDTETPQPDPMTFATVPYTTTHTWVAMEASIAVDPTGAEYYFEETSGNPGGDDSGWQDGTKYTDLGLAPATQYTYRVKARDKSPNQNETVYSTAMSATTEDTPDFIPTVPTPFLFMSGYADGFKKDFEKMLPYYTAIGGITTDADLVKDLRARGKVFLHQVSNNTALSVEELVAQWSAPFENDLNGELPGGFDAISIDELHSNPNGSIESDKVCAALQQLRALYPDKLIFPWSVWRLGYYASTYSDQLNAVNNYTDIYMLEGYIREGNPQYYLFDQMANSLEATVPGILSKTVFGLYVAQVGFIADDSTDYGYWGFLDEQFHLIKNDAEMSTMPGMAFWVWYRSEIPITGEFCGKLNDHYYIQGNTSYFGDGNTNQLITNPQFESGTSGWSLIPGSGGTVARFNYTSEGVSPNYNRGSTYSPHYDYGLKMMRGSSYNQAAYQIAVDPGMTYTVSAFVMADAEETNSARVTVTTDAGEFIAAKEIFNVGSSDWKRIIFNFDLKPAQNTIKIVLNDEFTAPGRTLYWDFIELEEAYPTQASPVIDSVEGSGDTGTISFSWWGNYGNHYVVQYSDSLDSDISEWSAADPGKMDVVGADWLLTFTEDITGPAAKRFYRVEEKRNVYGDIETATFQQGTVGYDPQNPLATYSEAQDCYIQEDAPDGNYNDENLCIRLYNDVEKKSLLKFDISSIPVGSMIVEAKLSVYHWATAYSTTATVGRISELTTDWDENYTTYNESDSRTPWPSEPGAHEYAGYYSDYVTFTHGAWGWKEFDATLMAQRAVQDKVVPYRTVNVTLESSSATNQASLHWFYSSDYATVSLRPKLVVKYKPLK